ncbi:glutaredoxin [Parvularcula maris]|uniref:Methylamine utilization protein MauE n=1 Tax=Parvularcula maris TaxID=2965077 RepID=A0A9X2L9U2_9PROT|nr:glutaredoxin [Parvularcula maris]MCQ8185764.1 glutaredoxin [Parvularcula maris]
MDMSNPARKAALYRMVMPGHVCPYGIKSKWLLERKGYAVEDHHLTTREETDAFKEEHGVKTTPQTFLGGERVGGYDALKERFLGEKKDKDAKTYTPVLVIFGVCALMAWAASYWATGSAVSLRGIEWFAAFSMSVLAIQKLRDVESFSTMFLNYDLLAKRWVPYGYIYPFAEGLAGVLMIAGGVFAKIGAPIALVIGTIGAVSVIKAVYVEKRDLKCACVGGNSNVPLGFLSLTENLVMVVMGVWMLVK